MTGSGEIRKFSVRHAHPFGEGIPQKNKQDFSMHLSGVSLLYIQVLLLLGVLFLAYAIFH